MSHFVQALRAALRLPLAEFTAYGATDADASALVTRTLDWADTLERLY